ncbi:unknown [Fusobacterium sp. CAG:649]|nr:unknown [Fusobacterium sp. CAG:649]
MELAVTILLSFKPDKAILVNIIPTPAIIALIIVEAAKLTIVDRVPVSPNITIAKPENNIIESLSLIFFPNIPARAIVSA